MFCGKCGAKIKDDARFCYNCGSKVDASSEKDEAITVSDRNETEAEFIEPKMKIKNSKIPKQNGKTVQLNKVSIDAGRQPANRNIKKDKNSIKINTDDKKMITTLNWVIGIMIFILVSTIFLGSM